MSPAPLAAPIVPHDRFDTPLLTGSRLGSAFACSRPSREAVAQPLSIAPRKQKFYWPKKPGRSKENLNCKVLIPKQEGNERPGNAECRHFAFAYALLSTESFFEKVNNESSIRSFFGELGLDRISAAMMTVLAKTDETAKQFVGNRRFGAWLCDMARAMKKQNIPTTSHLLATHDHLMALRLRRKSNPERICVTGYDPNVTKNHRRIVVSHAKALRKQTLADCFPRMSDRLTDPDHLWVIAAATDVKLTWRGPLSYLERRNFTKANRAEMLCLALLSNAHAAIKSLGGKLRSRGQSSMDTSVLLQSKIRHSSILRAMHAESLDNYAQALKRLNLDREALLDLLVNSPTGLTAGLCEAVAPDQEEQHAEEVLLKLGRMVRILNLDPEFTDELLTARDAGGCPALHLAVRNKHSLFVHAFGKLLDELGICGERASPLVAAVNGTRDGRTSAWDILSESDEDTHLAYRGIMTRLGVSLEDVIRETHMA